VHFLTWNVSLSATDWDTSNLCLLAVLGTAFAVYENGAQGMFFWPHLMTAVLGLGVFLFGFNVYSILREEMIHV